MMVHVPANTMVTCIPLVVHVLVVSLAIVTVASEFVVGATLNGVVEKSLLVIEAKVIVWFTRDTVIETTFDSAAK